MIDVMTIDEVAAMLRVKPSRLRRGWGPPRLLGYGRTVRYSRADVEAWFEQQRGTLCCTSEEESGGSSTSLQGPATVSARVAQIVKEQRSKLEGCARKQMNSLNAESLDDHAA